MKTNRQSFPKTRPGESGWEQKRAMCQTLLESDPDHVEALHFMGKYEFNAGNMERSIDYLGKAYALRPAATDVGINYALVLLKHGQKLKSIAILKDIIEINKERIDVAYLLANELKDYGVKHKNDAHLHEAAACYVNIIRMNQKHAGALNNLGVTFLYLRKIQDAEECFVRAIAVNPEDAVPYNNLGIATRLQHLPEQSASCCRKALELRPDYPEALNNLGNALKDLDDLEGAKAAYEQAIARSPDPDYQCNLAMVLLALGDFKEGWARYEWRKQSYALASAQPRFRQPLWNGEASTGQTLLLHGEQGFGDTIQFCRYAPLARERGFRVVLSVPPPLRRLVESLQGVDAVVTPGEPVAFDWHCPMMSLPLAFHTDIDSIPAAESYLTAEAGDIEKWRARIREERISGFRVGLVWSGQTMRHSSDLEFTNKQRSMPSACLLPLMDLPDVCFFNLQKGGPLAHPDLRLLPWIDACQDFADTAALVTQLDLVITVDTAVAHLAGALGKPVWVLNRFAGCWRWLRGRDDSPWYPSLRLFTQQKPGDWDGVVSRVKQALRKQLDQLSCRVPEISR